MIPIRGIKEINDASYRYQMPKVSIRVEGRGNGIKTRLLNIYDIAITLHRNPTEIIHFITYELGTRIKTDNIINGSYTQQIIQQAIFKYIEYFVLCPAINCKKPEVKAYLIKNNKINLYCEGCGETNQVLIDHKICTFIIKSTNQEKRNCKNITSNTFINDTYGKDVPDINDMTICAVDDITKDVGIFVKLVEYNTNFKGFIPINEIAKTRKKNNPLKSIKLNQEFVAIVSNIDGLNIELTKKRVLLEDEKKYMKYYKQVKKLNNILNDLEDHTNIVSKNLVINKIFSFWYENENENENKVSYTIDFLQKTIINPQNTDFEELNIPINIKHKLLKVLPKYFKIPDIMVKINFTIKNRINVNHITSAIHYILKSNIPDKFKTFKIGFDGPPNYNMSLFTHPYNKDNATDFLNTQKFKIYKHLYLEELQYKINLDQIDINEDTKLDSILSIEQIKLQPTLNIALVGSFSHGKSTVCKYLTGKKTELFKEELERNCTIKLGYSNCKIFKCEICGNLNSVSSNVNNRLCCDKDMLLIKHISFIDCPGHESLMSTMLSGAAVMDASLLLAASDLPIRQNQTIEHIGVINTLLNDSSKIGILLNKSELVDYDKLQENYTEIKDLTKDTILTNSDIIPISANLGFNMDIVTTFISNIPERETNNINTYCKLIVIRSFDVNKPINLSTKKKIKGGVIGGSLIQGVLKTDQYIEIRPGLLIEDSFEKVKYTVEKEIDCKSKRRKWMKNPDQKVSHTVMRKKIIWKCKPFITKIESIKSEQNNLDYAIPGGLIAIQTQIDPYFIRSDKLAGSVAGSIGHLPDIYSSITIHYKPIYSHNKKDYKLKKNSIININISGVSVNALIIKINQIKSKILLELEKPVCVSLNDRVALSIKINQSFKLCYWGTITKGITIEIIYDNKILNNIDNNNQLTNLQIINDSITNNKTINNETSNNEKFNTYLDKFIIELDNSSMKTALNSTERIRLPSPKVHIIGPRKTIWQNLLEISIIIKRPFDHILKYISSELCVIATKCGTRNKYVTLNGRFQSHQICSLLIKYCNQYIKCKQCKKMDTKLEYDSSTKLTYLKCNICMSHYSI